MNPDEQSAASATSAVHLPPLPSGWQPICYAVLAGGTMAALGCDVDLAGEHLHWAAQRSGSLDRLRELALAGTGRIWTEADRHWIDGPAFPLETPFPKFDRFSDGRWLVAGSRSWGGANARTLTPSGDLLDRFILGDGIDHVGIDAENRIWVGWSDEGTGSLNAGWLVPGQGWPPSNNGLALFTADGSFFSLPIWPVIADLA